MVALFEQVPRDLFGAPMSNHRPCLGMATCIGSSVISQKAVCHFLLCNIQKWEPPPHWDS